MTEDLGMSLLVLLMVVFTFFGTVLWARLASKKTQKIDY
ncbi:putative membrane protein [Brevibacillus laterosporus GI-9]|nr:putative membrane protein [Brevibacillus laterosporus GI-9]